jgi:hypothetical protein
MERETGIEPATSSLGSWRSTAELLPLSMMELALSKWILVQRKSPAQAACIQDWRIASYAKRNRRGAIGSAVSEVEASPWFSVA